MYFNQQEHIAGARRLIETVDQVARDAVSLWHLQGLLHKMEASPQTAM